MSRLSELYHSRTKREITFILIFMSIVSLITAFLIGIDDNPPGILLLYFGILTLIIAFIHHWREKRKFRNLLILSIIGFPIFVVLHNLFDGLSKTATDSEILKSLIETLSGISFLMALIVCPVGLLIGALGLGLAGKVKANDIKND